MSRHEASKSVSEGKRKKAIEWWRKMYMDFKKKMGNMVSGNCWLDAESGR